MLYLADLLFSCRYKYSYRCYYKTKDISKSLIDTQKLINSNDTKKKYGIIGCGYYAFSIGAYFINKFKPRSILGVFDPNSSNAINLAKWFKAKFVYSSVEELILSKKIKMIFICSNHSSHAEYAINTIKNGKAVHDDEDS